MSKLSFINAKAKTKELSDDILQIGAVAKAAKAKNPEIIDATIGALFTEDGKLYEFTTVNDTIHSIPNALMYAYPPTDGGVEFKEKIKRWVFQKHYDFVNANFASSVIATPGASGAISNTLSNYVEHGEIVLLPDIYWSNYNFMINECNGLVTKYPMFDGNAFNTKGFIDAAEAVVAKQNKLITIINDPCQNPTGYSMSRAEWETVIAFFNDLAIRNVPVILLYDIAYLDYADETYEESRDRFALLNQLKGNTLVVVTFSGSKTYSIYGLRLGAQIALSKDLSVITEFERVSLYSARARWSCPPKTGINLVNKLMGDNKLEDQFKKELIISRKLLKSRADIFLKEAKAIELPMFPYRGGYFVTLPHATPKKAFEDLIKANIYSIPLAKGIRIAVCALPLDQVKGLALKIKETIY